MDNDQKDQDMAPQTARASAPAKSAKGKAGGAKPARTYRKAQSKVAKQDKVEADEVEDREEDAALDTALAEDDEKPEAEPDEQKKEDSEPAPWEQHVEGCWEQVKSDALVAVRSEQKTDDLRRQLGKAVYYFFESLFTDVEIAAMRIEVKHNGVIQFPPRVEKFLREKKIKRPHFRSHNPISGIYAQAYFDAKVTVGREVSNRISARPNSPIIPFGVGFNANEEVAPWDRSEQRGLNAKGKSAIAMPQPHSPQGQSDAAIEGDVYTYGMLTFMAIDTHRIDLLDWSFRNAKKFWEKQIKEGLESLSSKGRRERKGGRPPKGTGASSNASNSGSGNGSSSTVTQNEEPEETGTEDLDNNPSVPEHVKAALPTTFRPRGTGTSETGGTAGTPPSNTSDTTQGGSGAALPTNIRPRGSPVASEAEPEPEPAGKWRVVNEGEVFPEGRSFRMNVSTGVNEVFEPDEEGATESAKPDTSTQSEDPNAASTDTQDGVKGEDATPEPENENEAVEASQEESAEQDNTPAETFGPQQLPAVIPLGATSVQIDQGQEVTVAATETPVVILAASAYEVIADVDSIEWQIGNREWYDRQPEESFQMVRMRKHRDGTFTCTIIKMLPAPIAIR